MSEFSTKPSSAMVAVSDIGRAKAFYSETLGLEIVEEMGEGVIVYRTGNTHLLVYVSDFAGTNKANAVVWSCGEDLEAIVASLANKGVTFEHYPEMGADYADGIHRANDFRMVWFKDPDGNILHLNSAD